LIFTAVGCMSIAIGCGIRQCGRTPSESSTSIDAQQQPPVPQNNNPSAPAFSPTPTVRASSLRPTMAPTPPLVVIQTTEELYTAVDAYLSDEWNTSDTANTPIGYWDVSQITNFSFVFNEFRNPSVINFDDDISDWDTSNAITMEGMFYGAEKFDGNISSWKTRNVENMKEMFAKTSRFVGTSVSTWDVSKVTTMEGMCKYQSYTSSSFARNRFYNNLKLTMHTTFSFLYVGKKFVVPIGFRVTYDNGIHRPYRIWLVCF
jgi:surface protein